MPVTVESGGTAVDRAQEAHRITETMGLWKKTGEMTANESGFVAKMHQATCSYGDKTVVTPKQLFWLRDLFEKYT